MAGLRKEDTLRVTSLHAHREGVQQQQVRGAPGKGGEVGVNRADQNGWMLCLAAGDGNVEEVKMLLGSPGIDVNRADMVGGRLSTGRHRRANLRW